MTRRAATVFAALLFSTLGASSAFAFGQEGCGAGSCMDCHSLEREEAERLLSGLVERVHSVEFAIVPGLWKVEVEGQGQRGAVYLDFSKSYVVSGRVLRLADWTDVSTGVAQQARKADLSKVPLEKALVMGKRSAPTRLVLFTDPQCPYCVKLHGELKKVVKKRPDVAVFLVLFPLPSHPDAYRISKSVVCSGSLDLLEDAFAGRPVPDPACEADAVDRWLLSGKEAGIASTPTFILPDGTILPGFKPAEKILEILEKTVPQP